LPNEEWEERHSPGNFTYAAHQAFFAGFLPTPRAPGKHPRPFAVRFPGSETTVPRTCVFDTPDIVHGLRERGYHTACIGGVGFFNKRSPLGCVLPNLFAESHWQEDFGVTDPHSTENQVARAREIIERLPSQQRLFLFLNVSAIHQPNYFYLTGPSPPTPLPEGEGMGVRAATDSLQSHAAALAYVDRHVTALIGLMTRRAPLFGIICSDHGTAYGEDGYWGHRLCHPVVSTVPYAEFVLGDARKADGGS
jgi:hypothetical protein